MKRYAEYKDSGIEWIGEIPRDWDLSKIKYQFTVVNGATPKSGEESYWNGDITWITPADYKTEDIYILDSRKKITADGLNSCGTSLVPKGSIIVSNRAPIGSVGISATKLCTNQGCKSLVKQGDINEKYIFYFLSIMSNPLNMLGRGTTFLELSSSDLANFKIPLPLKEDQQTVSNYLDTKTAAIDALITDKQKLIGLLKEKRQAIISEAVTKGLDKNAKMKDSGIEWMGEIPEGWEVIQLKYASASGISNGIFCEKGKIGKGIKLINVVNLYTENGIDTNSLELLDVTPKEYEQYKVSRNDLFYTRSSLKLEGIGQCNINLSDEDMVYECHIMKITPNTKKVISKFVYYYSNSSIAKVSIMRKAKTATMTTINQQDLGSIPLPLPDKSVQRAIVDYLDAKTVQIDTLISDIQTQIEKLKEHRQSIISEAVTGKVAI